MGRKILDKFTYKSTVDHLNNRGTQIKTMQMQRDKINQSNMQQHKTLQIDTVSNVPQRKQLNVNDLESELESINQLARKQGFKSNPRGVRQLNV